MLKKGKNIFQKNVDRVVQEQLLIANEKFRQREEKLLRYNKDSLSNNILKNRRLIIGETFKLQGGDNVAFPLLGYGQVDINNSIELVYALLDDENICVYDEYNINIIKTGNDFYVLTCSIKQNIKQEDAHVKKIVK